MKAFYKIAVFACLPVAVVGAIAGANWLPQRMDYQIGLSLVPVHAADGSVKTFYANKYEITNGQYARFLSECGRGNDPWFDAHEGEPADLPAGGMKKGDAVAFCRWLTAKCRAAGQISDQQRFHLPTDKQFTCMLLQKPSVELGDTPEARMGSGRLGAFIHGVDPTPPVHAGNVQRKADVQMPGSTPEGFEGTGDGFAGPAPVGRFHPDNQVLCDIEGNVSEYIREAFGTGNPVCIRGGSYATKDAQELHSSTRIGSGNLDSAERCRGFRVVLESVAEGS